jgi:hypothetical protein
MNLIFSWASYGLSSYQWYLMPALIVVLGRIQTHDSDLGARVINEKTS